MRTFDRRNYIDLLQRNELTTILYEYHLAKGRTRLPPHQFMEFLDVLLLMGNVGKFGVSISELQGAAVRHFNIQFNVSLLANNKGDIIKIF